MKPTSQPSFTRRPIHQSLLYFCGSEAEPAQEPRTPRARSPVFTPSYLFDVQEVFGFKGNGHALHWDVVAGAGVVAHIRPHGECHWFGLQRRQVRSETSGIKLRPGRQLISDLCLLERGQGLPVGLLPQSLWVLLQRHV